MHDDAPFRIGRSEIAPGETRDVMLKYSESYSGVPLRMPIRVVRGPSPGPAIFVTAAIHGDELNGTGIVRELIIRRPPRVSRGTLVLVPVVNMLGFEQHSRYMPDRRDLNRSFPGSAHGSLTARLARTVITEIVARCRYGIDLHSAASHRSNTPHVRADMQNSEAARIARAFGTELIVDGRGPLHSFRRTATRLGCATIVLEAGEIWKFQREALDIGCRGIRNVLIELGMLDEPAEPAAYQVVADKTLWVRAADGGILHFEVSLGEPVERGQIIATCAGLLGGRTSPVVAAADGIVMGITTLPAVKPGDPVCHIAAVEGGLPALKTMIEAGQHNGA
jgi:predicted deacylase